MLLKHVCGARTRQKLSLRDCYSLFYFIFLSVPGTRRRLVSLSRKLAGEQSGAVGACWAHNPEVGRSKLLSAKTFFALLNSRMMKNYRMSWKYVLITKFIFLFALWLCWKSKFWFQYFTKNQSGTCVRHLLCQKLIVHRFHYHFKTSFWRIAPVAQSVSAPYL